LCGDLDLGRQWVFEDNMSQLGLEVVGGDGQATVGFRYVSDKKWQICVEDTHSKHGCKASLNNPKTDEIFAQVTMGSIFIPPAQQNTTFSALTLLVGMKSIQSVKNV